MAARRRPIPGTTAISSALAALSLRTEPKCLSSAARLRDDLRALERAVEKQAVVLGDGTDCDVIALAEDQLEAAVQVFYVRGGRVRGQRGWVVDKVEETTPASRWRCTRPGAPAT